jgi:hypothetical protein
VKYLCLMYFEESVVDSLNRDMIQSIRDECDLFAEELKATDRYVASAALQRVSAAATVRTRDRSLSVTDGPFAETKEQLGGFFLIEARDLNEAIQVASRIPPGRLGSVEVRPLRDR